jgi:purine-nucleoside/S-methyl-5'-thioadenosine phosphorylase / adenosine deaminase
VIRWEHAPGPYEVVFSTREGGVSEGPYASLNLGRATADEPERVDENRRRLCAEVGGDPDALAMNYQHHSADVLRARAGSRGERADGLWTDDRGLPLLALTADCLPIVLARVNGGRTPPALAVLHAGWRGLIAGIAAEGVNALGGGLVGAVVGPGIGPCCYAVGEEVAAPFRRAFGLGLYRDGKLDLWTAAERALRAAGVARVDRVDLCTACDPKRFFSHRRDDGLTGRQGVIGLIA